MGINYSFSVLQGEIRKFGCISICRARSDLLGFPNLIGFFQDFRPIRFGKPNRSIVLIFRIKSACDNLNCTHSNFIVLRTKYKQTFFRVNQYVKERVVILLGF